MSRAWVRVTCRASTLKPRRSLPPGRQRTSTTQQWQVLWPLQPCCFSCSPHSPTWVSDPFIQCHASNLWNLPLLHSIAAVSEDLFQAPLSFPSVFSYHTSSSLFIPLFGDPAYSQDLLSGVFPGLRATPLGQNLPSIQGVTILLEERLLPSGVH